MAALDPWTFGWSQIFALIQAVGVLLGTGIAFWGIRKWRIEQVGRRQCELAEEALAYLYEAQDVFDDVRSPFGFSGEGATRIREENETDLERQRRDREFVPFERLDRHRDFFLRVQHLRPKIMAVFGRAAAIPLEEVLRMRHDFIIAVQELQDISEDLQNATREDWEDTRERKKELEGIKRKGRVKPDPFDVRLSKATKQLENHLEPLLRSRYRIKVVPPLSE